MDILCQNTIKYGEPEKTTGPSGEKPIAVLKVESSIDISLLVLYLAVGKLNNLHYKTECY